jgi:type I restriction enzyme S subunit
MPRGDKGAIMRYAVPNVPLDAQIVIADTLSALDARITANRKINYHLEQIAQAIFKSRFVDFEPFGGEMPHDWREGMLGDHVEIKRGGSPRPIQDFLSDTGLRWLKISDVTALQTPFVFGIKEHIKESGLKKTVFLKSGALVLSNSATPGIPKILGVDTCIHDGWLYFPKSFFSNEFLYLFFKQIRQDLVALGNGSVFTNLKTDILKAFPIAIPDEATLRCFNEAIIPVFQGMENCTRESAKIADLRDFLLPRLMSGELSVADLGDVK